MCYPEHVSMDKHCIFFYSDILPLAESSKTNVPPVLKSCLQVMWIYRFWIQNAFEFIQFIKKLLYHTCIIKNYTYIEIIIYKVD